MGNPKFGTPIFGFVSLLEKMPLKTNRYEYKFLIFWVVAEYGPAKVS